MSSAGRSDWTARRSRRYARGYESHRPTRKSVGGNRRDRADRVAGATAARWLSDWLRVAGRVLHPVE